MEPSGAIDVSQGFYVGQLGNSEDQDALGFLGMQRVVRTVASVWAPPHRIGGLEGLEALRQTLVAADRIRVKPRRLMTSIGG